MNCYTKFEANWSINAHDKAVTKFSLFTKIKGHNYLFDEIYLSSIPNHSLIWTPIQFEKKKKKKKRSPNAQDSRNEDGHSNEIVTHVFKWRGRIILKGPYNLIKNEPVRDKTNNLGFRPGPTQTGLYCHRSRLETGNFGFKKKRDCTIHVAKTKALISFAVTAKLVCAFVFAYANCWFSHAQAQIL